MSERPTAVTVHYIINVTEDVFESFTLFWRLFFMRCEFIVRYCNRHTRHLAIRADADVRIHILIQLEFLGRSENL